MVCGQGVGVLWYALADWGFRVSGLGFGMIVYGLGLSVWGMVFGAGRRGIPVYRL